ncbi:GNAT family N-acetyltransferase [Eudoraea chungangensis]|uniref:GNAT family N-acetyltransferase n=1 Tax=Eudoraea chungangensis TaxID=1481905 RepID=UPI0023ED64BD|nr:GNAT family protein [Eudoraea chungangensis]
MSLIKLKKELLHSQIKLENDRVRLIPFEETHEQELKSIIFNDNIWKYMGMYIRNKKDFEIYKKNTIKSKEDGICYPFVIIDKTKDAVAGCTRFGNINLASEKCEIGWTWYGADFQGTGLNKACKYELLRYGFEVIGFRRIQFSADLENIRSQKAIEKLGAKKEGIFRNNYVDSTGKSRHDVYYSIIREDWQELKIRHFEEFE